MPQTKNAILGKMLDRLFAGLASGPNLNCRPHSSRQRFDWTHFSRLQDLSPLDALRQLLSDRQATKLQARVSPPKSSGKPSARRKQSGSGSVPLEHENAERGDNDESNPQEISPEEKLRREHWSIQQSLLSKLRSLAEDAREYEQDTGVHVLHVGFPLLSLPPNVTSGLKGATGGVKRLLAPIAFIPVTLELRAGPNPVVSIEGLHDGADFLVPNEALFAWLERQTGRQILPEPTDAPNLVAETDSDAEPHETATATTILDPWQELNDLVKRVAEALHLRPYEFTAATLTELSSAPRTDDENSQAEIVPAAVLGLFPMNNQGLLRDMQALVTTSDSLTDPLQSFVTSSALLEDPIEQPPLRLDANTAVDPAHHLEMRFERERLVTMADPCQTRAVRFARECQGLVIHGPPGTGKSQTITNIIGDHLSRGERVLMVCDKRTALDVVARRLEHLGLGSLCALIHDPQHDQRNLYMQVREQLEQLTSTVIGDRAASQLQTLDKQLQKSYETLAAAWSLIMSPDQKRHVSFHQRMGEWLECALPSLLAGARDSDTSSTSSTVDSQSASRAERKPRNKRSKVPTAEELVTIEMLEAHSSAVRDLVDRAVQVRLAEHPWKDRAGMLLATFLQRSASVIREDMATILELSAILDQTCDDAIPEFVIPDDVERIVADGLSAAPNSFPRQRIARQELRPRLQRCLNDVDSGWRMRWAKASPATVDIARRQLADLSHARTDILSAPLDAELGMIHAARNQSIAEIASEIGVLEAYLQVCDAWYFWFAFGTCGKANQVFQSYGLAPGRSSAVRLKTFLAGMTSRRLVATTINSLTCGDGDRSIPRPIEQPDDDATLLSHCEQLDLLFQVIFDVNHHPGLTGLTEYVSNALIGSDQTFVAALESSLTRADAIEDLRVEMVSSELFHVNWLRDAFQRIGRGQSIASELSQLAGRLDSLGEVLRLQSILTQFPDPLRIVMNRAIASADDVDAAMTSVHHQVLTADIKQWLQLEPQLLELDGTQLSNLYGEIRRLEREKQPCVRELILDLWTKRQRDRLLTSTGSRLSSLGADLRRRLTTRGERAMRLRQVINIGDKIEGGDPLFDLRPVWMASPETVAQIFPREALFDVVIFDEASQCRLEEALPVLTRAKRVVIAGDPKQLPPTRFFESAVITSDNADVETDQELFEAHQSEVEDLLTASLSLNIQESHLDVHYRSRNADLVEFSNQQFYGSRLQAIPGHPGNRIRFAPISLYHAAGIYDERSNTAEAAQVVKIVADLLRRSEPPTIGIACFNLTQRDLILEALADLAAEDAEFASRLAVARNRIGTGAFEGLFVKNLENVQGDERDHMIISTTYGPDKQGRFFRRFGPLGQVGGGRRLNVLITRAREEVHLVTSIPAELYRNLPPIPEGQFPGGGYLLFAYLNYAERLGREYQNWRETALDGNSTRAASINERPSRNPSKFACQLGQLIARNHHIGCDIHWGNDGFCVDVAFHHPRHPEERTLGLLCDGTRFQYADDPIAWDVFRTTILEEQGWQLNRCWTPQFFRDPEGFIQNIATQATRIADEDPEPETISVEPK